MLYDYAHGCGLSLRIGTQTSDLRSLALRMREDKRARDPVHTLQRDGTLVLQFLTASLPSVQEFRMARFRLRQASFGPRHALLDLCGSSADLLVGFLEEFC